MDLPEMSHSNEKDHGPIRTNIIFQKHLFKVSI